MNENKPEWYARLRKGPFEETVFDEKMGQAVEERARGGGTGRLRSRKRRLNLWSALGALAIVLAIAVVWMPKVGSDLRSASGPGQGGMTEEYVLDHLQAGMTEAEVIRSFGRDYQGMSVRRDFAQDHREDPNDIRTWSAVDAWRYDFGVEDGYQVRSDLDLDDGFDVPGIRNGDIQSQLVIVWKNRQVDRAIFKYKIAVGLQSIQIGPGVESSPTSTKEITNAPPPNEGIRALGLSSLGTFELLPKGGNEKIEALGAPSCLGLETDIIYSGSYGLYYSTNSIQRKLIQEWQNLELIQKKGVNTELIKYDFPDLELFLFLPRYTDCHGLEFYAFGVDKKTGEASPFTFEQETGETVPYWTTSPAVLPAVSNGELVVEGGRAAGQDGATRYHFKPDVATHQLVIVNKEQIP